MSQTMDGVVTLVQESRFQLTDERGVSHLFILSPYASAETEQLAPLQHRQARVRVRYKPAQNAIGNQATSITLLS